MEKGLKFHKKRFDSQPVYSKEYLKTKVKHYDKVNTIFYENKILKDCTLCLFVNNINRFCLKNRQIYHYQQFFSEECKYNAKENKMSNL